MWRAIVTTESHILYNKTDLYGVEYILRLKCNKKKQNKQNTKSQSKTVSLSEINEMTKGKAEDCVAKEFH